MPLDSFIALELCSATAWRIEEYRTAAGETPVRAFIAGLPPNPKAEAAALIKLAETLGNRLREPHSKALGGGLFELRRNQVRMFWIPADVLAQMRSYQKDAQERVKKAKTERKR